MSKPLITRLRFIQGSKNVLASLGIAATINLQSNLHGGRRLFPLNLPAGQTINLPFATGKGGCFRLYVVTTYTGSTTINTQTAVNPKTGVRDVLQGYAGIGATTGTQYPTTSSTHILTQNGSTQGGLAGSYIELEDVAPGFWRIAADLNGSGTPATPFS